jgi:hypothetical protein
MPHLHETMFGRKLLEHDIPEISRALQQIAREMHTANELKKYELIDRGYSEGRMGPEKANEIKTI